MLDGYRENVRRISRLSTRRRQRTWNAVVLASITANWHLGREVLPPVALRGVCFDSDLRLTVRTPWGIAVVQEIFGDGLYASDEVADPALIIDLGGNIGLASVYFACRYPNAQIICVEPSRAPQALLASNVRRYPNISVVQKAVTASSGTMRFHEMPMDVGSSLHSRPGSYSTYDVETISLPELLDEIGSRSIGLLKIDIEGAELQVLECLPDVDAQVVMIEVHLDLGIPSLGSVLALLTDYEVNIQPGVTEDRFEIMAVKRAARPQHHPFNADRSVVPSPPK